MDVVTGMPVQLMAVRARFGSITQSVPHVLPALPLQTAHGVSDGAQVDA